MRRIAKNAFILIRVIYEELMELDRRTDLTERLLNSVKLNDDYDDYEERNDFHFGIVKMLMVLPCFWAILSTVIILLG